MYYMLSIEFLKFRLAEELGNWADVQHLYLTRVPIEDEANKTVCSFILHHKYKYIQ